ncbi:putative hydrolase or acyltransferase of alpha/beta superfamily [Beggiatoa alba B18LD]|uniref:Putative hydrolase or acyltransferase of alpha/beta superfamily n=1 Tax=Beggiatoa alba B18LD TaxID=395493 RepID=I3CDY3_9GAMM|nr:alpha/beta hydrolase [Beggiatoa alba]EIJ41826.1 putative hydrolase or acyltransferase of alpha/beta superfamily [Beggiatoa alba B18LD]
MPFIKTQNLSIHYEQTGQGKIPIVFVHGNFASWRWWRCIFPQLPENYIAYLPDLRGCGDTEQTVDGYHIEQLAQDLYDFVTALALPAFHLVGHSLGGAVSQQFALDHPECVTTLTLVAPAPAEGMSYLKQEHNSFVVGMLESFEFHALLHSLHFNRSILLRIFKQMVPSLNHQTSEFTALVDDAARMPPEAIVGFLNSLTTWNVLDRLKELSLPVLIIWGERDTLVKREALERMILTLQHAQLVILPMAGHAPQLEQPDYFNKILFEFIETNGRSLNHQYSFATYRNTATTQNSWWRWLKSKFSKA